MKRVRIIGIAAAFIFAVCLFVFLTKLNESKEIPKTQVVIATTNIPINATITEEMLMVAEMPSEAVMSDAILSIESVVGQTVNSTVYAGDQLRACRLVQYGDPESGTLSYIVKEGMRAISINVTDIEGVSGMLKPGNHIDLIAQYETETGAVDEGGIPIKEQAARIILQNVEILAVDAYMTPAGAPSDVMYTKLTLSVTPEQAIELSFVDNLGTIRAVLRSTLDTETIEEHSITVDDIHITRD